MLGHPDPVTVASLNATVLAIVAGAAAVYLQRALDSGRDEEARIHVLADEVNRLTWGNRIPPLPEEVRPAMLHVAMRSAAAANPADPEEMARRGGEAFRFASYMLGHYPFSDGSSRLEFQSIDEVREWARELHRFASAGHHTFSQFWDAARPTITTYAFDHVSEFRVPDDVVANLAEGYLAIYAEMRERFAEWHGVDQELQVLLARHGAARRRQPRHWLKVTVIAPAVFVCGVVVPLLLARPGRLWYVWVPCAYYVALAIVVTAGVSRRLFPDIALRTAAAPWRGWRQGPRPWKHTVRRGAAEVRRGGDYALDCRVRA